MTEYGRTSHGDDFVPLVSHLFQEAGAAIAFVTERLLQARRKGFFLQHRYWWASRDGDASDSRYVLNWGIDEEEIAAALAVRAR